MTPGNAFYVLGLPADASMGDIEREGRKLLGLLELGVAKGSTYSCALGTFSRDATMVREAMATLRDPARRARESALAAILGTAPPATTEATTDTATDTATATATTRSSIGPAGPMPDALRLSGYRGL